VVSGQDYSLGPFIGGQPRIGFLVLCHVLDEVQPGGFALEFGVAEGNSLPVIAARMPVVGFDSWEGLPEKWGPYPPGSRACPIPEVPPNAGLVAGWFADTLPRFDFGSVEIGLVHFDADLYSSTATVLDYVGPHLKPGCCLVFDEWHGSDWCEEHEQRAWREYAERTGVTWDVIGHDQEAWAIRLDRVEGDI
jgi:hypothetical protein